MPRLPRKSDLDAVDRSLGDISTKLDRMTKLDEIMKVDPGPINDISTKIEKIARWNERWAKQLERVARRSRDLRKELQRQNDHYADIDQRLTRNQALSTRLAQIARTTGQLTQQQRIHQQHLLAETGRLLREQGKVQDRIGKINADLGVMPGKWKVIAKLVGGDVLHQFDRLGKALIVSGLEAFSTGFEAIEKGVKSVYELFERWTKAIGSFRLGIGAASDGIETFVSQGKEMEGGLRSLTDEFGIGLREVQAYTSGFGFLNERAAEWTKVSVVAGRALAIGSEGAGQLARSMELMGDSAGTDVFMEIVNGANAAQVATGAFGKEVISSKEFMASFGKTGRKVFMDSVAFVKRLGMSIRSLESFTNLTDTFDSAAQAAAKMNTVFGTSVNALDMLLEDDPAKRFEMVREQIKLQGKDLSNLTRQEKVFLAETLKISQEELNGVISSGETLEDFQKKKEAADRRTTKNQEFLQKAMAKTRQTMFAFGQAWDRVTMSVIKLIRPFTDVVGLTKANEKGALSFGEVMSRVFGRLIEFIDEVAANKDFQKFMQDMATGFKTAVLTISEYLKGDDLSKNLQAGVKFGQEFWDIFKEIAKTAWDFKDPVLEVLRFVVDHAKTLLMVWGAMKGAMLVGSTVRGAKNVLDVAGEIRGGPRTGPSMFATMGRGLGRAFSVVGRGASALAGAMATAASSALTFSGNVLKSAGGVVSSALPKFTAGLAAAAAAVSAAFAKVAASAMGRGGLYAMAAAAGWMIGRFIGSLEVGGKSIDDWTVTLYEGMGGFFSKLWRSFKDSRLGDLLGMKETAKEGQGRIGLSAVAADKMVSALQRVQSDQATEQDRKFIKEISAVFSDKEDLADVLSKTSGGKISADQMKQLVDRAANAASKAGQAASAAAKVGTAAIAPRPRVFKLPEIDVSVSPTAASVVRPEASAVQMTPKSVNFPGSQGEDDRVSRFKSGDKVFTLVAGDVYLDSRKVGRHVVREMLEEGE